jgi:PAS domain S-box-containing protein
VQSTAFGGDTSSDAAHLLTLIEKQPSCLLRVGIDGRLLAANESALRLLGTGDLAQVLGRTLTERILPDHRDRWREFLTRVWEVGSGSIECDLTNVSGVQRTLLLQGVALHEHPDSNRSMLIGARDTSANRRLEESLQEDEASRVQEYEAQRQQLETAHAADRARLQQTLAEERQLALMLKEREGRQMLEGVRAELEQARAEHQRLATSLADREAEQQRLTAAHAVDRERTFAELQRLEVELDQRNCDVRRLVAERAAERAEVEQGLAEAASILESLAAGGRIAREVV